MVEETLLLKKPQSFGRMALNTLRKDWLTMIAIGYIVIISLLAIGAGLITGAMGIDYRRTEASNAYQQPYIGAYIKYLFGRDTDNTAAKMLGKSNGVVHWLGTDQLGRDLLARLLFGARVSLTIGLVAAIISLVFGVLVGAIAGYYGGVVDDVVMWFINTVTTIPQIYLLVIINAILSPSVTVLTIMLGVLGWFGTARFMRGNVFKVRELDYALAARATGSTNWRILTRHIIPNSMAVIIVLTFLDIGGLILAESILSALGLGVPQPEASWGNMLQRANSFIFQIDPVTKKLQGLHLLLAPGILTTLTVLAFSLIGDGLRDALDPTLKNKT